MKTGFRIILGVLLIFGGVLYALNACGVLAVNVSFDGWWTLFIIVPAVDNISKKKGDLGSWWFLSLGILLLLAAREVLSYKLSWALAVSLLIIAVGLRMLFGKKLCKKETAQGTYAVFGGKKLDYGNSFVPALRIGAIFGGVTCRLKEAEIGPEGRLDAICIFGGADVFVPENVNVKTEVLSVFGGVSDKRDEKNRDLNAKTLHLKGLCIFGGIDIK